MFVEVKELSKIYSQNGQAKVQALENVSFSVNKAEFIVITGQSGSGKSTLLHLLGGLDQPTSGQILVNQQDITKLNEEKSALWRRSGVGFVFQSFNLIPALSARENIRLPMIINVKSEKEANKRADDLLEIVGLSDRATHKPNELSGGQQQRVAIARSLINKPAMVLADEPTGALDSNTSLEIIGLLRTLAKEQNQTVIMVTHNKEMEQFAETVIVMKDGKILNC